MILSPYIHWSVDPEIFRFGAFTIRWYGLLFATSFFLGYRIIQWIFQKEKLPKTDVDILLFYVLFGVVIGARLGHCLFYEPGYYLSNPIEIIKFWRGGLASHGAAIGILTAIYLYSKKKTKQTYFWVVDRVVIVVALSGFFIRVGNLFNSEILGKATDVPWAFIFTRVDMIPRHPTQIYEALAYLSIFLLLITVYRKFHPVFPGMLFGIFLTCIFGFRIFVEFFKENQSTFEAGMTLNMGQLLSIPFLLIGLFLIFRSRFRKAKTT